MKLSIVNFNGVVKCYGRKDWNDLGHTQFADGEWSLDFNPQSQVVTITNKFGDPTVVPVHRVDTMQFAPAAVATKKTA